jgi:xanthine dehydrogenase accessory factor
VLVSVVATEGSTPREAGARMVVTPAGFRGTIGGGSLEWQALARAQAMLGGPAATRIVSQALGPELGQCCGGRVKLAFEAFDRGALAAAEEFARREREGPFTVVGRNPEIQGSERFGMALRPVLVAGAGHVGRALMLALAPLPVAVNLVDPRPDALPAALPPNASALSGDPVAAVMDMPAGSFVFIMSHSHALDLAIAAAALARAELPVVGLIGSATKRARFAHRLRAAGIAPARVAALLCPIGVPGLKSKLPAAIAASVAVQVLMLDEALAASGEAHRPAAWRAAS